MMFRNKQANKRLMALYYIIRRSQKQHLFIRLLNYSKIIMRLTWISLYESPKLDTDMTIKLFI